MVPSTIRMRGTLAEGEPKPFSFNSCRQSVRSHDSLLRKRFSSATSETSAQSANFARTAVSRREKPLPTCSSRVRKSASPDENPRNRSTAPLRVASSCQPPGNKPASTLLQHSHPAGAEAKRAPLKKGVEGLPDSLSPEIP